MFDLLSVDTIAFTLFDYPMSYIEFIGTILYLWSVWLIARKKMLTWPVGIVSVLLYMILFYQIRLYSDALEQVYYLGASIYGWWWWHSSVEESTTESSNFRYSSKRVIIWVLSLTLAVSLIVGAIMSRIHLLLPTLFPEAASLPYLDALTTIMSFTAMGIMAQKRIESWYYWIIVDVIGIWLYYVKEVRFISLLYVILLFMAINGLLTWNKTFKLSKAPAYG
ncbi:MAG: nicotinamide mononucleotide transporter [Anaerolineae bacterium]|nr:nicotinamide mononucleotide transporter [Anaerolineae bacterium]